MQFPFPYIDTLREQIAACQLTNEWHPDCYIVHFHVNKQVRQLPLWLPTVPQGCQVLKKDGPLSCQLYIEQGYVVQFDVVDMGMNTIDWEYLWSHEPIFDFEYDLSTICNYLESEALSLSCIHTAHQCAYLTMKGTKRNRTICLWNYSALSLEGLSSEYSCPIRIYYYPNEPLPYLVKSDDGRILIKSSLVCLQS